MVDYSEDQRIGKAILQTTIDGYRKLRNTLRYLLGALEGYDAADAVDYADMPPLERYVLHRLWTLDAQVREAYAAYRFSDVWRPVSEFSAQELSALYFDIRKDALYCDAPGSLRRRACRTVMAHVFDRLTIWLAPLAPFTMEEAWATRFPAEGSNTFRTMPTTPDTWCNRAEAERWGRIERVLGVVTGALEVERREKRLGAALEAAPRVHIESPDLLAAFDDLDAAEVFRTSQGELVAGPAQAGFGLPETPGVSVEPRLAHGDKCVRCWRVLPEVKAPKSLCLRCEAAVTDWDGAHQMAEA
jgi:isoleucyl-tRNA synthetase